jgi:hypothetical protein
MSEFAADKWCARDMDFRLDLWQMGIQSWAPHTPGKSGLGIEAQREAVARYLNGGCWAILAEFTETESGKRADRPELDKALAAARTHRVPLVVPKVHRLTRSVAFLSRLLEAGVDVRFADLPTIEGPTGGSCCNRWRASRSWKPA